MRVFISILIAGCLLLAGLALPSCKKTLNTRVTLTSNTSNSSVIQVYMAMVNASRNYVYLDSKPVTGALMTSGSVFPGTGFGSSIDPGLRAFLVRDTLPTTTQVPLSFAENMQVGRNYTVFIYDTITSPKEKTFET